jgi:hypothetical protein
MGGWAKRKEVVKVETVFVFLTHLNLTLEMIMAMKK